MAVLLLQGPLGPFNKHLTNALKAQGVAVYSIQFNGGDAFFSSPYGAVQYTGTLKNWPNFFTKFVRSNRIKTVLAYGDCRAYHREAKRICLLEDDVRYFAFEEGYLRPNYITLEEGGVNGYSPIKRSLVEPYAPVHSPREEVEMGGNMLRRACYAMSYDAIATLSKIWFRHYQHHRPLTPIRTGLAWVRAYLRKQLYKFTQPDAATLVRRAPFFLVPLQVHNDAQIEFHSEFDGMEAFIEHVMSSFAASGCDAHLVFKHHPMDRGFTHYGALIKRLARGYNIESKVQYIHDQHLPTLLKHCKGVVTINSTTALQAFYHRAPVKALGDAFFDMEGLTYQGKLDTFWLEPSGLDDDFSDQFKAYLLEHGQINGSFYCHSEFTVQNVIEYLCRVNALPLKINPQGDGVCLQ